MLKNRSVLLTNWRSSDYQTCHKKQIQKRLAQTGVCQDISVFTKNAQPQFGFTEMNEHKFLSETALVKTSLPLTQFLSNTKQGFPLSL